MSHDPGQGPHPAAARISFGPVQVWPLSDTTARTLRIELSGSQPQVQDPRSVRRWEELCRANARLHDGPIWSVRAFDPVAGLVSVAPDRYRRYAVRPTVGVGVSMLAVRGVVTAIDQDGARHVLTGLRSTQTRVYGDLWEVIPGGGVPADGAGAEPPGVDLLLSHMRQEAREEAGLEIDAGECTLIGVCDDSYAGGFDVLVRISLRADLQEARRQMGQRDWEHQQVRWMPVASVREFDSRESARISPPTRAIFRFLGWI